MSPMSAPGVSKIEVPENELERITADAANG